MPPLTLNTWQASHDEPFSGYSSASSSSPAFKTRKTATGRVPAQSPDYSSVQMYDPAEFIKQTQSRLSPMSPRSVRSRRNSNQTLSPSSYLSQSPSSSISDGLTNPTTLTSAGMSRSDSLGGSSFYGPFAMLNVNSQMSESMLKSESKTDDSAPTFDPPASSMGISIPATDPSLSLSHTGAMVENATSVATETIKLPLVIEEEFAMSRTCSSESTDSSKSRISRRSQEQAALSTRPIAPKDNAESISRQPSTSSSLGSEMGRQRSAEGSKIAIQKVKYQRPAHEKIKCNLCDSKPDGYRGPHELRRHMDNKHNQTRKVWICKDVSPDKKFLSKCKQCRDGKMYGAYYNAACHLRRIHYNPRGKGKKADKSGPRRGGNGGGDYPSMDHLKLWMEEITVPATMDMQEVEDDEEEDVGRDDVAADASPSEDDYPTYDVRKLLREAIPNAEDFATTDPMGSHFQERPSEAFDAGFVHADFSVPEPFPNYFPLPHDDFLSQPTFSLTLNNDSAQDTAPSPPISTSIAPPHGNSEILQNSSVKIDVSITNVESTDLSLTSSMNSPVCHFDQFNSFSFDSDLLDFS